MKKLILFAFVAFTLIASSFGQTEKKREFMTYYSLGGGFATVGGTANNGLGTWGTIEAGCWGIEKPVMYGVSLDFCGPDYSKPSVWLGIKPYYQIYQARNYYLFTYAAPKWNFKQGVSMEIGLTNYTQITEHFYSSVCFGYAKSNTDNFHSPVFSLGLNLVY